MRLYEGYKDKRGLLLSTRFKDTLNLFSHVCIVSSLFTLDTKRGSRVEVMLNSRSHMAFGPRQDRIRELFPNEPAFRLRQIEEALFHPSVRGWNDITSLSLSMREALTASVPFQSLAVVKIFESKKQDTFKAIVNVEGDKEIETVLMKNPRGAWTICVSSQVGCAMACGFCATGKMGLIRQLHSDEIVDQYRLWQHFLLDHPKLPPRISNVVFMGMGEPLANYENVKATLNTILAQSDHGKTRITVSTVGVLPRLEQLLNDPDWPHVRMAVSLHSADPKTRKEIVPTSYDAFLPKLEDWAKRYLARFGNRRHHLTFEYVMLSGVNDTPHHAKLLAEFVKRIGNVRVNLIPYNFTGCEFTCSTKKNLDMFEEALEKSGVTVTRRRTMGEDIEAACGQLVRKEEANT